MSSRVQELGVCRVLWMTREKGTWKVRCDTVDEGQR